MADDSLWGIDLQPVLQFDWEENDTSSTGPNVLDFGDWQLLGAIAPFIEWDCPIIDTPPFILQGEWELLGTVAPFIEWDGTTTDAPGVPISATAAGMVQCSGSIHPTITLIGAQGLTQTYGQIPAVQINSHTQGLVQCSGSINGTISAHATAVGVAQCSGFAQGTLAVTASGLVSCQGFATIPIPGSTLACLTPPVTPPTPSNPVNAVY